LKLIHVKCGTRKCATNKPNQSTPGPFVTDLPPCIVHIGADSACYGCTSTECMAQYRDVGLSCSRRKLAARQHVFLQGDAQTHVYLVKIGAMRLYKMLGNGRRQIIGFKFPGDFIALGHDAKYRFSAQAIVATELRSFPIAAFHAVAGGDLRFLTRLYDALADDLGRAHDLALTVGQRDAEGSIASFFLDFDARMRARGTSGEVLVLPMPRADIADYLGITHETVSRIFTQFKKRSLIELHGHRGVRLIDRVALQALADGVLGDELAAHPEPAVPAPQWIN